jgi:RNA polymerase nonessential primary-like sigma factor
MPVAKVRLLLDAQKTPYSLEMKMGEDENTELGDLLRDTSIRSPEEVTLDGDLSNEVRRALAPLSDREKEVLRLRYGLGTDREYTLEEIGRRLSVTRERVRQIESRALQKVRAARDRGAVQKIVGRSSASRIASPPDVRRAAFRRPDPTDIRLTAPDNLLTDNSATLT